MIKTEWLNTINTKFYAYQDIPLSNTSETEYTSGRVITFQRNTKNLMTITCKIKLSVEVELPLFWAWFNDVLGQTAGAFHCSALGSSYYRFTEIPTPEDTDREYRTLNLTLCEVA